MGKILKYLKKKYYREKFRKTVENKYFGKISYFLIDAPKPTGIINNNNKLVESYRKNLKNTARRNSEKL